MFFFAWGYVPSSGLQMRIYSSVIRLNSLAPSPGLPPPHSQRQISVQAAPKLQPVWESPTEKVAPVDFPLKTGPLKRDSYKWNMLQYNKPYSNLVVFHPQNQAEQPGFSSLLSLGCKDHANLCKFEDISTTHPPMPAPPGEK